MFRIGFIDYYLDEWHANNYPRWIRESGGNEMQVTHAWGMIPSPHSGMTSKAWCEKYGVTLCGSVEELISAVDGIIVLSPDNAEMHMQLCEKPLRSGKPTYVDKTFAPDEETAKKIFAIAESSGTPCYSTSALRYACEYTQFAGKAIRGIATWGPNGIDTYSVHQLEPIAMLMQCRAEKVLYVPGDKCGTLNIVFRDGRSAVMTHFDLGGGFSAQVSTDEKVFTFNIASDFWSVFIDRLCAFFRSGEIMVPHEETLNIMAIREAALKGIRSPCRWIGIPQK